MQDFVLLSLKKEKLSEKKNNNLNLRNTRIQFGPVCINPFTHATATLYLAAK